MSLTDSAVQGFAGGPVGSVTAPVVTTITGVDMSDMTPREKKDYLYEIGRWGTMGNLIGHVGGAGYGLLTGGEDPWQDVMADSMIGGLSGGGLGAAYGAYRGYQKTSSKDASMDQLFLKLAYVTKSARFRDWALPIGGAALGGLVAGHAEDIPGWIGQGSDAVSGVFGSDSGATPVARAPGPVIPPAPNVPDLPYRSLAGGVVGGVAGKVLADSMTPQRERRHANPGY